MVLTRWGVSHECISLTDHSNNKLWRVHTVRHLAEHVLYDEFVGRNTQALRAVCDGRIFTNVEAYMRSQCRIFA